MRKRAVVTGGAGFLGSHLCKRLLHEDCAVICMDNLSTGVKSNVAGFDEIGPFDMIEKDVTEPLSIDGPIDYVLHFASPASPRDYLELPIETLKVGSLGTFNSLALAREKKARYLLASTSEIYGDPQVHPQDESYWGHVNPVGLRGVYDEAKRFSEALTMAYHRTHGISTGIVRIFNTHGPRMREDDGRAIPNFICQAVDNLPLTVAGKGDQTRSIQYVSDLVEGCIRMLDSSHAGPVNIGNPCETSISELARIIISLTASTSTIKEIARPEDDPSVRRPDIEKARQLLGWSPIVSLEDGLVETIRYFRLKRQQDCSASVS
jgi:dTDP-glucose 4,6-dehydratase